MIERLRLQVGLLEVSDDELEGREPTKCILQDYVPCLPCRRRKGLEIESRDRA